MGRFIVGESTVRAPYWPVSPNSFGGQIGASPNGDAPGDIYRLIGGVVLRRDGTDADVRRLPRERVPPAEGHQQQPRHRAGRRTTCTDRWATRRASSSSACGPARRSRSAARSGRPSRSIPLLPVSIRFVLTYPDGRRQVADGVGDRFGSFAGPTAWPLDVPGVYRYQVTANWNGYEGRMPGLPESGGEFFVYSKTRPAGATGLQDGRLVPAHVLRRRRAPPSPGRAPRPPFATPSSRLAR